MASGMRQWYSVELEDGRSWKVRTNFQDTLLWEKAHKRGWFEKSPSAGDITWRIWNASVRGGQYVGTYADFAANIDEAEPLEDEDGTSDDPDPTATTPGEG